MFNNTGLFKPGIITIQQADELNRMMAQVRQMTQDRGGRDQSFVLRGDTALLNPRINPRIVAKITGHEHTPGSDAFAQYDEDCRYSWVEWTIRDDDYACEGVEAGGRNRGYVNAFPAIEINGSADVEAGTRVEMWLGPDGRSWRFSPGGTGGNPSDFTRPDCIIVIAQQVCCNQDSQFSGKVWYLLYTLGGTPIFIDSLADFSGRVTAYNAAVCLGYPLDANGDPTFCGECPEQDT